MTYQFVRRLYILGFLILFLTLCFYQIIRGQYYLDRAKNNYVRVVPSRSKRGVIYDRNSVPIAYDKASFNIAVIPYQIKYSKDELFSRLARFFLVNPNTLYRNYSRDLINYFSPVDVVKNVSKADALRAAESFPDVLINPVPKRFYPYSYSCAHILGYVKKTDSFYNDFQKYGYAPSEYSGIFGVEQYYDSYLRGSDGGSLIEINAKGQVVGYLGEQKAQQGKHIYLTVDARLQQIAYQAMEGFNGAFIIMDVNTGAILCMVSKPSFDPNQFIKGVNVSNLLQDEHFPLLNRAIQSSFPLGSTFKLVVSLAALEEGKANINTTFNCDGTFNLGRSVFRCLHVHGPENLLEGIAHSCNIYFYNLGILVGAEAMSKWGKSLGLSSLSGIDLPYEKKGFIPSPEWKVKTLKTPWYKGDNCNFAIGQGYVLATPMENLLAMNVFASRGYLVKPHIIKRIDDVDTGFSEKHAVNVDMRNLDLMKMFLVSVVEKEDGTARLLNDLGLKIAGKTGTAQAGGKSPHGWFVGFFPHDKPKYTVCVFLEHGVSSYQALKVLYTFLKSAKEENRLEL